MKDPLQTYYSYPLAAFSGRWRMVKQENLDEILEALGIYTSFKYALLFYNLFDIIHSLSRVRLPCQVKKYII